MLILAYLVKISTTRGNFKKNYQTLSLLTKKIFNLFFLATTTQHMTKINNQSFNKLGCQTSTPRVFNLDYIS
jgi:UDP-N-acetylglucosamine 2-epimerase